MSKAALVASAAIAAAVSGCAQPPDPPRPAPPSECSPTLHASAGRRTEEELKQVFECHGPRLYARYKKALASQPRLGGRALFALRIEPSGQVSSCRVLESNLPAELLDQLTQVLLTVEFGTKETGPLTLKFPLEFLPE